MSAVKAANLSGSFLVQSYLSTALMFAGVYFLIFLALGKLAVCLVVPTESFGPLLALCIVCSVYHAQYERIFALTSLQAKARSCSSR
jgi:hypothetical protein